jgi:predicted acylesterase/phospholipase RssA
MIDCNLVVAGGASNGWALYGAYRRARMDLRFVASAGASIGACVAAIEALRIDHSKATALMTQLTTNNGIVGGSKLVRFHPRIMWSRGGGMHDWSYAKAALKTLVGENTRLRDTAIPLSIIAGDIYTGQTTVLNSITDPSCLVWEALAASTAVWPIADAQEIPSAGTGNRLYVDGGWGNNIPTEVFENAQLRTCVISLGSPTPEINRRDGFTGVVQGCLELALNDRSDIPHRSDDILIQIPTVGSGFDFNLAHEAIKARDFSGRMAAQRVLLKI